MIQAKLAGRKNETRRIINPQPSDSWMEGTKQFSPDGNMYDHKGKQLFWLSDGSKVFNKYGDPNGEIKCPYGRPGDVLYARETWSPHIGQHGESMWYAYKATDADELGPWRPSIHMPKVAARIWDRILEIRVERLQDITPAGACDEGIEYDNIDWEAHAGGELVADFMNYTWRDDPNYKDYYFPTFASCIDSYRTLWESINGEDSWDLNPWVWVIRTETLSTTGRPKDI